MKKVMNVLAVGVGGQGIIRMSNILAEVAFRSDFDIKKSAGHRVVIVMRPLDEKISLSNHAVLNDY